MSSASITSLLMPSRPAAVVRLVVTCVVDAVERLTFRPLAHIGQEVLKLKPAFANSDAAATITFPVLRIRVPAAIQCRLPAAISSRLAASSGVAVRFTMGFRVAVAQYSMKMHVAPAASIDGPLAAFNRASTWVRLGLHRELTPSGVREPSVCALRLSYFTTSGLQ